MALLALEQSLLPPQASTPPRRWPTSWCFGSTMGIDSVRADRNSTKYHRSAQRQPLGAAPIPAGTAGILNVVTDGGSLADRMRHGIWQQWL